MNLLLFGATGATGQQVMEQALARGHQVTAVARRPEAITFASPHLTAQGSYRRGAPIRARPCPPGGAPRGGHPSG